MKAKIRTEVGSTPPHKNKYASTASRPADTAPTAIVNGVDIYSEEAQRSAVSYYSGLTGLSEEKLAEISNERVFAAGFVRHADGVNIFASADAYAQGIQFVDSPARIYEFLSATTMTPEQIRDLVLSSDYLWLATINNIVNGVVPRKTDGVAVFSTLTGGWLSDEIRYALSTIPEEEQREVIMRSKTIIDFANVYGKMNHAILAPREDEDFLGEKLKEYLYGDPSADKGASNVEKYGIVGTARGYAESLDLFSPETAYKMADEMIEMRDKFRGDHMLLGDSMKKPTGVIVADVGIYGQNIHLLSIMNSSTASMNQRDLVKSLPPQMPYREIYPDEVRGAAGAVEFLLGKHDDILALANDLDEGYKLKRQDAEERFAEAERVRLEQEETARREQLEREEAEERGRLATKLVVTLAEYVDNEEKKAAAIRAEEERLAKLARIEEERLAELARAEEEWQAHLRSIAVARIARRTDDARQKATNWHEEKWAMKLWDKLDRQEEAHNGEELKEARKQREEQLASEGRIDSSIEKTFGVLEMVATGAFPTSISPEEAAKINTDLLDDIGNLPVAERAKLIKRYNAIAGSLPKPLQLDEFQSRRLFWLEHGK